MYDIDNRYGANRTDIRSERIESNRSVGRSIDPVTTSCDQVLNLGVPVPPRSSSFERSGLSYPVEPPNDPVNRRLCVLAVALALTNLIRISTVRVSLHVVSSLLRPHPREPLCQFKLGCGNGKDSST